MLSYNSFFFFQAEDGIRDLVRSRGLGDVYKRQEIGEIIKITDGPFKDLEGKINSIDKERGKINVLVLSLIHI